MSRAALSLYFEQERQRASEHVDARASAAEDECSVYYLRRIRDDLIKIGFSHSPRSRARQLTEGGHGPLELLVTEPGGRLKEAQRHKEFACLRQEGEWFRPGDDLLEHINTLCLGILVP